MQDPASPPTSPPVPPGWYPDPQGAPTRRYWDGERWTEHTAPFGGTVSGDDPKTWAVAAHLSALGGLVIGFAFAGPLIVYLIKRDDDPFIRDQAAEALNFNLSWFIYAIVGGLVTAVLIFLLVGLLLIPVLIAGAVAWIVLVIVAAVKAGNGEAYRYPLTIRFVN